MTGHYCGAIILFESGCVAHLIANVTAGARLERYELHGRRPPTWRASAAGRW